MRKGYARITIDIPEKQFLEFKKVCEDSGQTMSEVLRYAITGVIEGFTNKVKVKTTNNNSK